VTASDAQAAVRVENAENVIATIAAAQAASAKNVRTAIIAECVKPVHVRFVRIHIRHPTDVPEKNVSNAISAQCAVVVTAATKKDREDPVPLVRAKNVKTPTAMSVMFAAPVTTAIHPHVPEVYVKSALNVPDRDVQKGHAVVKDLRVMQTYVLSAKNACYAVRADVVMRPAQAPEASAPELSVLIAECAAFAIKPAVAQVHVDAIHPVATIVLVPTRYVSAINAITERAPVHRIMARAL